MNANLNKADQAYKTLRYIVNTRVNEFYSFVKPDEIVASHLPSSAFFKEAVKKFEKIDDDCFSYYIHGKKFFVTTEYQNLTSGRGIAKISTFESKPVLNNYPNQDLTDTNLVVVIDVIGNVLVNGNPITGSVALAYFTEVGNYLYPNQMN